MNGDDWQTHHLVWLLDDDLNELGCISGMADWDDNPTSWTARARPDTVAGHRWWEYKDIGTSTTEQSAIGLLRQHVIAHENGSLDG